MLILTRQLGEQIRIGDEIRIVVTVLRGGQVSLGIEAPRSVPVVREELLRKQGEVDLDQTHVTGSPPP